MTFDPDKFRNFVAIQIPTSQIIESIDLTRAFSIYPIPTIRMHGKLSNYTYRIRILNLYILKLTVTNGLTNEYYNAIGILNFEEVEIRDVI